MYDKKQKAIAIAHSGWRGSTLNIYKKTIETMKKRYHSKPEDILVCISPSLGPDSAEFQNYKTELPESFWQFQIQPYYFDFWKISRWQLEEAGILPHHIEIAGMDTLSNPTDFFSHRRDKPSGRNATIAFLKTAP